MGPLLKSKEGVASLPFGTTMEEIVNEVEKGNDTLFMLHVNDPSRAPLLSHCEKGVDHRSKFGCRSEKGVFLCWGMYLMGVNCLS